MAVKHGKHPIRHRMVTEAALNIYPRKISSVAVSMALIIPMTEAGTGNGSAKKVLTFAGSQEMVPLFI
jgi:hypothetical protein